MLHESHQDGHGVLVEAEARADRLHELHSRCRVVVPGALAEIVEQRGEHKKVRATHPIGERSGVGRRLPQMSIDSEAVIGVALRPAAHRRPLGQQAHEEAALVERLQHIDGAVPLAQQRHQLVEGAVGPAVVPCGGVDRRGEPVERSAPDGHVALGGYPRRPQDQRRISPRIGVGRQFDLPVDEHQPLARPFLAAGLLSRDAPPRAVGYPHDRPRRRGDTGHQLVS